MAEPIDLAARIAELEERLADLERRDRQMKTVRGLLGELFPPEVRGHLRASQREQLLAARSFLDHWIARLERGAPEARGRETITVE